MNATVTLNNILHTQLAPQSTASQHYNLTHLYT